MKASKKTNKLVSEKKKEPILTFYPILNQDLANQEFINSVEKPQEGSNGHLDKFMIVIDRVSKNYGSFSIQDVLFNARLFEIPVPTVVYYFNGWTEKMIRLGKLEMVNGAYNDPIFIFI